MLKKKLSTFFALSVKEQEIYLITDLIKKFGLANLVFRVLDQHFEFFYLLF